MTIGFVYLLGNRCMPQLYKIGCTERSPARRAAEISNATGVPMSYDVICYWEGDDFQAYERELHRAFELSRVNDGREFFKNEILAELVNEIENRWIDGRYSFCLTEIGKWYLEEDDKRGPR